MTTPASRPPKDPPATEAEILALLERHYARPGNGGAGEYAFLRQVRNASGFDATRTFDAVVVGLWPSRGHDLHVLEVKVSRSDWRRELAKPDKAEDAAKVADRFSVVAPRGVVDVAELPATWGYIEVSGGTETVVESEPLFPGGQPRAVRTVGGRKVRVVRSAPLLRPPQECRGPISRGLLVTMLRAAGALPEPVSPEQKVIDKAVADAVLAERAKHGEQLDAERANWLRFRDELNTFRNLSGLFWHGDEQLRRVAQQARLDHAAAHSPTNIAAVIRRAREDTQRAVSALEHAELRLLDGDPSEGRVVTDDALFPDTGLRVTAAAAAAADDRTAGQRLRDRQQARIAAGWHPLSISGARIPLHPDAPRTAYRGDDRQYPTCGGCAHRRMVGGHARDFPKCLIGYTTGGSLLFDAVRYSASTATDVRAWWPACVDYTPKGST
jgi:hypothetical protein